MEQWPSGLGAGLPNQRSQIQNHHKAAEKLSEPFILQKWVSRIPEDLVVKVSPRCDSLQPADN